MNVMKRKQFAVLVALITGIAEHSLSETVTLTAMADSYLSSGDGEHRFHNYGGKTQMLVGNHPSLGNFHGLLRFDLSSLGSDAEIVSVTLKMSKPATGVGGPFSCRVVELSPENGDWVEGTTDGKRAKACTWDSKGSANWIGSVGASRAGKDYLEAPLAEYNGSVAAGDAVFSSKDGFADAVKKNAGGFLNLGFGMNADVSAKFYRFSTKEGGAPAQLIIEYTKILG